MSGQGGWCVVGHPDKHEAARRLLLAMGAVVSIDAGVRKAETFDRTAVYQVFLNDFLNVTLVDKTIPNGFGVDDEDWAVLALVQAAGLVNTDAVLQASGLYGVFQGSPELFRIFVTAAGAGG